MTNILLSLILVRLTMMPTPTHPPRNVQVLLFLGRGKRKDKAAMYILKEQLRLYQEFCIV